MIAMSGRSLEILRGVFTIEDPWHDPTGAGRFELTDATSGVGPRLTTVGFSYYDASNLYVVYHGLDEVESVATYTRHDDPVYEEDAYEIFLSPSSLTDYFELEVSLLGTTFDARIHSPDGVRATMIADVSWDCPGFWTALRKGTGAEGSWVEVVMVVPFSSLDRDTPKPGETWRGNLFRVDRSPTFGDSYSAWCPTLRTPADFHLPAAFGEFHFR